MDEVSVVITTYNSKSTIVDAISSAFNQVNINVEIIIVDDLSDDFIEIKKVKTCFQESDIKILQPLKKGNANISRNIGIENASCDYVAFLDADDTWEPNHLFSAIDSMLSNNAELCFSKVQFVKDGVIQSNSQPVFKGDMAEYIFKNGAAVTSSIVAKRTSVLKTLFDEKQQKHQDWEFLIRFEKQFKICQSDYIGLNYTLSSGNNMSCKFNPGATVRFLNKTLSKKYHKVMLLSQLYPMIQQRNSNAIISLKNELNENYKFTSSNLGLRIKLYSFLFSKGCNPFSMIIYKVIDIGIRSIRKVFD